MSSVNHGRLCYKYLIIGSRVLCDCMIAVYVAAVTDESRRKDSNFGYFKVDSLRKLSGLAFALHLRYKASKHKLLI